MSHTPITPDDPRLTAYVLGELPNAEIADVEQAIARSPELQAIIDELRETTTSLFAALHLEPVPHPQIQLPERVGGKRASPQTASRPARRRPREALLMVNAVTLLLLVGVVVALQSGGPSESDERRLAQLSDFDFSGMEKTEDLFVLQSIGDAELQQRLTTFSDLMERRRFAEAQAVAHEALAAHPDHPVTRQLVRRANVALKSSPSSGAASTYQSALQDIDLDVISLSALSASGGPAAPGERGTAPVERHIEKSYGPIRLPEMQTLERLKLQNQLGVPPDRPAAGSGQDQTGPFRTKTGSVGDGFIPPQGIVRPYRLSESAGPRNERFGRALGGAEGESRSGPVGNQPIGAVMPKNYRNAVPLGGERLLIAGPQTGPAMGPLQRGAAPSDPYDGSAGRNAATFRDGAAQRPQEDVLDEGLTVGARIEPYNSLHRFQFIESWDGESDNLRAFPAYGSDGGESYAPIVENEFIVPEGEAALSTFSLDVDTASYSNVRRLLTQQQLPPPDAVRLEELVNYFDYDLPQPENEDPFSVTLEATSCPWNPQHRLVRIGLKGREIDLTQRPLTRLVFLLDVSGSMSSANKLPLVKDSMKLLVEQLGENDRIAIVTYAGEAQLKLDSTPGDQQEAILAAIDGLRAGGSTNGAGGIQLAYEIAARHFEKEASNRIILCTDGDFNVGVSSDDELVRMIEQKRNSGVFLSIFGYGYGNLKDSKLEALANKGNGHYAYIDDLDEARKVFIEELTGMLYTIAQDVKLQVEFNPANVAAYRLLGYENRLLAAEDFNNDQVDAGELGAGHTVTALYEIVPTDGTMPVETTAAEPAVDALRYQTPRADEAPESGAQSPLSGERGQAGDTREIAHPTRGALLTVKLRYKQPNGETSVKREFSLPDEPRACSQDLQFAAAVTGFGLLLRNSQYAAGCNWDLVIELAEGAKGDDEHGRRGEFVDLARQARHLWNAVRPSSRRLPRLTLTTSDAPPGAAESGPPMVLQVERASRVVWINRGALDDVRPRMTFQILSPAMAEPGEAAPASKGRIEVIQVDARSAVCRILEEESARLISPRDGIESPHWPPRVTEVVAEKFVTISLGSAQGVRDGEFFQVIRLGSPDDAGLPAGEGSSTSPPAAASQVRQLGELRVIDVQTDSSVCLLAARESGVSVQPGDRVTPRP